MVSMLGLVCLSIYFKRWFYKRHTQLSVRMNAQWIGIHCDWRLQFMWNVTACTVNMLWSHCDVRWTTLAECVFRSDITLWFHYETHIWSSMMSSILMMPCQREVPVMLGKTNPSYVHTEIPDVHIPDITLARPEVSTVSTWTFCERTVEVLSDHSFHPFHSIFFRVEIFSNTMLAS